jgi:hypothetical protein
MASVRRSFAGAVGLRGSRTTGLTIAGRAVTVVTAGSDPSSNLVRALDHLRSGDTDHPGLVVHVWDSATGAEPPLLPGGFDGLVEATGGGAGPFFYAGGESVQVGYQTEPNALSVLDTTSGTAWYWARDFSRLPYWDRATPFRHLLNWWLSSRGLLLGHGAAVGRATGGALLAGKGGSGKSTSALACLDSALRFAGDDYVALDPSTPAWAHSLYRSAKLVPRDVSRFPHLTPLLANGERLPSEKAVLYLDGEAQGPTIAGFPLRAILLPKITGARARILQAAPSDVLQALAPSTIFQLHPPRPDALSALARLVRTVPGYVLEMGRDLRSIPVAIARLLDRLLEEQAT